MENELKTRELCPHGKDTETAWCEPCFRADQKKRWGYSPWDYCDLYGRSHG